MMMRIVRSLLARQLMLLMAGMLAFAGAVCAGEAGKAVFVRGAASLRLGDQVSPLGEGALIPEGATLITGQDGYVYVKLADQGFLVLRPQTEVRVVAYRPVAARPAESVFRIELVRGVARSITGEVAEKAKGQYRFNTPVAAIGVRGTDFVVYADAQVTRVLVHSGGIVASPFGEGCAREALGPCNSALASVLAASTDKLLEVRVDSRRPTVLDLQSNPQLRALSPDYVAPPRPGERGDSKEGKAIEPQLLPILEAKAALALTSSVPQATTTAPTTTTQEAVVEPQRIFWGRWAPVAGLGAGQDLAKFVAGREALGILWPSYAVARDATPMTMPREGIASFALQDYEAGIFMGTSGTTAIPAKLSNSQLSVNFGTREYATQFVISGGDQGGALISQGRVQANGAFESDAGRSNMAVVGGLAGEKASQAGYVFMGRVGPDAIAAGGTFWRR